MLNIKVATARSKVKPMSHHDVAHLQPPTNVSTKYQLPTPYGSRDKPGQDIIVQGHYTRLKVKTRSHQDTPTSPNKYPYQVSTSYTFGDIAGTRLYRSRSLQQGQKSSQGHIMMMHIDKPQLMSLPNINFIHLMVSEI